ncbi:MAG: hypothetical protein IPK67_19265 [Planctomycetes bacterium]|nr:hypothetical protein [Planctomycetota bacterium]
MRVLLLNPPGRRTYIRDYFCSKTTKSNYLFHPIDLVVLSGTLAERHETQVLDAMAEGLDEERALRAWRGPLPDAVISLVGSVSWDEDRAFLARLARLGPRALALGDVLQEDSETRLAEEPWLEAALHVFVNQDAVHYLEGNLAEVREMTLRRPDGRIERIRSRGKQRGSYRLAPAPRTVSRSRLSLLLRPFGALSPRRSRTTRCPYPCTFGVIGTLGFQTRPVQDVLEELDHLRARHARGVLHGPDLRRPKPRALELCLALERRGDLSWTAFTRPDTADDGLFAAMARAGCHTVIMGVESADEDVLASTERGLFRR